MLWHNMPANGMAALRVNPLKNMTGELLKCNCNMHLQSKLVSYSNNSRYDVCILIIYVRLTDTASYLH